MFVTGDDQARLMKKTKGDFCYSRLSSKVNEENEKRLFVTRDDQERLMK